MTLICEHAASPAKDGNHANSVKAISPEQYQVSSVVCPLMPDFSGTSECPRVPEEKKKNQDVPFLGHLFTRCWQQVLALLWKSSPAGGRVVTPGSGWDVARNYSFYGRDAARNYSMVVTTGASCGPAPYRWGPYMLLPIPLPKK